MLKKKLIRITDNIVPVSECDLRPPHAGHIKLPFWRTVLTQSGFGSPFTCRHPKYKTRYAFFLVSVIDPVFTVSSTQSEEPQSNNLIHRSVLLGLFFPILFVCGWHFSGAGQTDFWTFLSSVTGRPIRQTFCFSFVWARAERRWPTSCKKDRWKKGGKH